MSINVSNTTAGPTFLDNIGGEIAGIFNIIIVVLGFIASILLLIATGCQRILRVPFFIFIASWVIANLVTLGTFVLEIIFMRHGTWVFPDFWCKYHKFVLQAAVLIRLYHMPTACVVAFFSRRYLTMFKQKRWANIVFPLVIALAVWILFLVLSTPYIGTTRLYTTRDGRQYCDFVNFGTSIALESVFIFWVPALLCVALLLVWAFLFVRRSKAINIFIWQRENQEGMVLCIIISVFVVTRLALILFKYIEASTLLDFLPWSIINGVILNTVQTIANSDFFFTPTLLLLIVPYYRSIFCLPCRGQPAIVEIESDPEPSAVPLKTNDVEQQEA